ncbi:uncharacterized protein LOC114544108 [Dendronephthya gigantea]|uniref:uncharacterized protein LOC114525322 n=1 Tax=Dendronephthya gigantea TaxID=151771 RepID=UPI001069D16C|nr:uncharacterized protein LOC114525322 [Dendronephthya gigantea]XP_028418641.1 uncharacterized protein LOC114544108 [Dendronephthya gigantea]
MNIKQNENEVNSSYMLFQRYGKQESSWTHFELHYDMDKWKVGKQLTSQVDPEEFVVSYATIEQVRPPSTTLEYLPAIKEDTFEDDVCKIQATQFMSLQSLPSPPARPPSPPLSPLLQPPSPHHHLHHHPTITTLISITSTTITSTITTLISITSTTTPPPSPPPSPPSSPLLQPPPPSQYTEPGNEEITPTYKPNIRDIQGAVPVTEERQPVWSFAQAVFHTDGQSKTFFKVIDDRKEPFQSSTFMYRGERIKVSRGIKVTKNCVESSNKDIDDDRGGINDDYEEHQIMDSKDEEDYIGYSEIWDEGNNNATTVNNEMMEDMDVPVARTITTYEMATEQDLFQERNCSWYLKLHGSRGACEISSNNFDAIAKDDDNTLLGSLAFSSGIHRWVIQGLGIFCAVGVCYSGEDARVGIRAVSGCGPQMV